MKASGLMMMILMTLLRTTYFINGNCLPFARFSLLNFYYIKCTCFAHCISIFNKPGVAGAVLQTSLSLIHSFMKWWFVEISSYCCFPQNNRSRDLTFWYNAHHPMIVMCHMSHITCGNGRRKKASQWRVCYQRGLPSLDFCNLPTFL